MLIITSVRMESFSLVGLNLATLLSGLDVARLLLIFGILLFIVYTVHYFLTGPSRPILIHANHPFHSEIISKCKSLNEIYWPSYLLFTQHVSTIFGISRLRPKIRWFREIVEFQDGGILALDWSSLNTTCTEETPILLCVPGLNGGSRALYLMYTVSLVLKSHWRCVVMNYRGTNGIVLKTPKGYSGAYTDDLRHVINLLHKRLPKAPLFAIGYSLGANILVKYLGEEGTQTPLTGAISMSNPFDFIKGEAHFDKALFLYDFVLTFATLRTFSVHDDVWRTVPGLNLDYVKKARKLRQYDERCTKYIFGYESVDQYYYDASSARFVPSVRIPLLLIHALDDPIIAFESVPIEAIRENPNCLLVLTKRGGHVAFPEGIFPLMSPSWADRVCLEWLTALRDFTSQRRQNLPVSPHSQLTHTHPKDTAVDQKTTTSELSKSDN
jgi:predicted alpha/beta-fold hydrolase